MAAHAQERKFKKPPACDTCKARRVLCHPQPNGEPCPRCAEKNIICTTTPIARGRPRKHPPPPSNATAKTQSEKHNTISPTNLCLLSSRSLPTSSRGSIPDISPDFIQHCFQAIEYVPQYAHPLLGPTKTNIKSILSGVNWDLYRVTPQMRVLAMCLVCAATLVSFHPFVLGNSSNCNPESFADEVFFGVNDESEDVSLLNTPEAHIIQSRIKECGRRRASTYRILRDFTLHSAWETGILLQSSEENAASCYFLDMLEYIDCVGSSRPWGVAYLSHIRVLAPLWHSTGHAASDASDWAKFLMFETLISTQSRTPILATPIDQLLLAGPEPPPLEGILSSLQKSAQDPHYAIIWTTMRPFMYHVTTLARQLSETISGDYPRLERLSEAAVLNLSNSLSLMQSIVLCLLDRIDAVLLSSLPAAVQSQTKGAPIPQPTVCIIDNTSVTGAARVAAYTLVVGFTSLVLSLYRELEYRETADADLVGAGHSATTRIHTAVGFIATDDRTRKRLRLMHDQTREMAVTAGRLFVRGLRYLPRLHYAPSLGATVCAWAEFCLEGAEVRAIEEEEMSNLITLQRELWLLSYSLDMPQSTALLLDRVAAQLRLVVVFSSIGVFLGRKALVDPPMGPFVQNYRDTCTDYSPGNPLCVLVPFFKELVTNELGKSILTAFGTVGGVLSLHLYLRAGQHGRSTFLSPLTFTLNSLAGQLFGAGFVGPIIIPTVFVLAKTFEPARNGRRVLPPPAYSYTVTTLVLQFFVVLLSMSLTAIPTTDPRWLYANYGFQGFPLLFLPLLFFSPQTRIESGTHTNHLHFGLTLNAGKVPFTLPVYFIALDYVGFILTFVGAYLVDLAAGDVPPGFDLLKISTRVLLTGPASTMAAFYEARERENIAAAEAVRLAKAQ
ncbi:hypothetical protein MIND_01297200 [Mycena indigotica]|uniref:Zn(2)-C6 fungal-type domain-containing protein n=1 Tax=Mycena indigotica TaxID=2126181 RepID=A0A8H6S0S4_9AGAR|nr:uncharacterized protein MIND_01297200 [Mycena indigotica]KAF7290571.1 hypothetical protein MIND_01297200 [Mycena indigotica]